MTTESDNAGNDRTGRAYRNFSNESAPADVNRKVLAEAAAAVRPGLFSTLYARRRPLAFAATLVLGITLVYDMQSVIQRPDLPYSTLPANLEESASLLDDASNPAGRSVEFEALSDTASRNDSAGRPRRNAAQELSTPPAVTGGEARQSKMAKPSMDVPEPAALMPQRQPAAARGADSGFADRAAASKVAAPAAPVSSACDDQRFESAESWWRCVAELRANGDESAANDEWQSLLERYPEFRPAE